MPGHLRAALARAPRAAAARPHRRARHLAAGRAPLLPRADPRVPRAVRRPLLARGRRRVPGRDGRGLHRLHQLDRSPRARPRADAARLARRAVRPAACGATSWSSGGPTTPGRAPRRLLAQGHRVLNAGWWPTYYVRAGRSAVQPVDARRLRDVAGERCSAGWRSTRRRRRARSSACRRQPRPRAGLGAARLERRPDTRDRGRRSRAASRRGCACWRRRRGTRRRPRARYAGFLRAVE